MKNFKTNITNISLFVSSFLLISALFLENFLNLIPCDLCKKQQGIHFLIIIVSIITIVCEKYKKFFDFFYLPIFLVWLTSALLSLYHYGIEQKYWIGFSSCVSLVNSNEITIDKILSINPIKCDVPQLEILYLSLSGWNSLISFSMLVILFIYTRKV